MIYYLVATLFFSLNMVYDITQKDKDYILGNIQEKITIVLIGFLMSVIIWPFLIGRQIYTKYFD